MAVEGFGVDGWLDRRMDRLGGLVGAFLEGFGAL